MGVKDSLHPVLQVLQEPTTRRTFFSLSTVKRKRIVFIVHHSRLGRRDMYDYYIIGIYMFGGCRL